VPLLVRSALSGAITILGPDFFPQIVWTAGQHTLAFFVKIASASTHPAGFLLRTLRSWVIKICRKHYMFNLSYVRCIISTGGFSLEARLYREFFRALSNQTRFSIVQLLRNRPHYVNEMAERLGIEQSRVSHNLACLLNCGFVESERDGKNKFYRLNSDLQPVLNGIEKHLAKYAPALDSCKTLANESKPVVVIAKANEPALRHRTFGRKGK
jgi:DNA-binding transcriptional ArsR family regulator